MLLGNLEAYLEGQILPKILEDRSLTCEKVVRR
jgi:hypothetical protein